MRILFAGTPDIAIPSLEACVRDHEVVGVLTAPDAPQGRGRTLKPSAVKARALELGLEVLDPARLDGAVRQRVQALGPDLLVCFAYGKIFGPRFLNCFPRGGINVHPSLLPELRGPSPIASAILLGLDRSGITVQTLGLEMDAGDILAQEAFAMPPRATTATLGEFCAREGAMMLGRVLRGLEQGDLVGIPQDPEAATWCGLIEKSQGLLDWTLDAKTLDRRIRAFDPWPRTWTTMDDGQLGILEAEALEGSVEPGTPPGTIISIDKVSGILVQTGGGILAVRRLQVQGKNPVDHRSFANGYRHLVGTVWGARHEQI